MDADQIALLGASMPLATTLGIEFDSASPGVVEAHLEWRQELCTAGAVMHGGAVMALADTVGAIAAFLNLPSGATGTTTVESKTNFLGAVREGALRAVARPLHVGRTTIVVETLLTTGDDERLVAKVTQTQLVMGR